MIRPIWGCSVRSGWKQVASSLFLLALIVLLFSPGHCANLAMLDDEGGSSVSSTAKPSAKDFPLKAVTTEMLALNSPDWFFADPGKETQPQLPPSVPVRKVGPRSPPV
ncbi:MAG: hypothetical protein HY046_07120 [Acidobacteria bacterium]|nr:hypothetical protein [Acidobacteriota bacterium]